MKGLPVESPSGKHRRSQLGNAYVVTQLNSGAIQLDRLVSAAPSVLPGDARTIATAGTSPHVAGLPSNNGALVVYTNGTQVLAGLTIY